MNDTLYCGLVASGVVGIFALLIGCCFLFSKLINWVEKCWGQKAAAWTGLTLIAMLIWSLAFFLCVTK